MAETGYLNPGGAAQLTRAGVHQNWSTLSNALTSDNLRATTSMPVGGSTHYLVLTNFSLSLPLTATITGIEARLEGNGSRAGVDEIRLVKNGSITGSTNLAAAEGLNSTPDVTHIFGGDGELGGFSWTAADVNALNFGVAVAVENTSASATATAGCDVVTIKIYYTFGDSHDEGDEQVIVVVLSASETYTPSGVIEETGTVTVKAVITGTDRLHMTFTESGDVVVLVALDGADALTIAPKQRYKVYGIRSIEPYSVVLTVP